MRWAHANFHSLSVNDYSFSAFLNDFHKDFELPLHQKTSSKKLLAIKQGQQSVAGLSINFRIAAREAEWNELALRVIFSNALNDQIKDQLAR